MARRCPVFFSTAAVRRSTLTGSVTLYMPYGLVGIVISVASRPHKLVMYFVLCNRVFNFIRSISLAFQHPIASALGVWVKIKIIRSAIIHRGEYRIHPIQLWMARSGCLMINRPQMPAAILHEFVHRDIIRIRFDKDGFTVFIDIALPHFKHFQ